MKRGFIIAGALLAVGLSGLFAHAERMSTTGIFTSVANTWSALQSFNSGNLALKGATSGAITVNAAAIAGSNTITLPAGTTDFSATGCAGCVLKQASAGSPLTVAAPAHTDLSDYVATTWTPSLAGSTTPGTPTYVTRVGTYEKLGRQVTIRYELAISAWTSPAGNITITGSPQGGPVTDDGTCAVGYWSALTLTANYTFVGAHFPAAGTTINIIQAGSAQNVLNLPVTAGSAFTLIGFCSFHI